MDRDEVLFALVDLDPIDFDYVVRMADEIRADWASTFTLYSYFKAEMDGLIEQANES